MKKKNAIELNDSKRYDNMYEWWWGDDEATNGSACS